MSKFLDQLIAERDRLTIAIEVLQERGAKNGGVPMSTIRRAVDMANGNGHSNGAAPERKKRKPYRQHLPIFRTAGRDVADVPIPTGLDLANVIFPDAVAMAVRAVEEPIPTPELVSLLKRAGVKLPKSAKDVPPARYIGVIAAHLARQGRLKKTPTGWAAGTAK